MRLLALDFDGVIADSGPEAFVVAVRTWCAMRDGSLFAELEAARTQRAPARARLEAEPLYARFVELMPLGNRAEDYGVILDAIDRDARLPDQAAYDTHKAAVDPEWLRAFHKRFYRIRTALSLADPEGWLALMAPYPRFLALLRRRADDVVLAIATAKDRRSVGELLHAYGIRDLFGDDRILDKETGVTKRMHLAHLHDRFGFGYPEMTFVDDKVNHLDAVAPLGVRCALAAWGYNGARERDLARERGHIVCTLEDAEEKLFVATAS
jgi:phosphoglycolate phosphatase-like HAD superfamily hydrolase